MRQHPEQNTDSTDILQDTTATSQDQPSSVFITENPDTTASYKQAPEISRDLTPDWVLYFSIASLVILAWIRLIYSKFITIIFNSAFNYLLSLKLMADPGVIQKRIFFFLNSFYYLTTGIFLYLTLDYFHFYPFGFKEMGLLLVSAGFLLAYSLFRYVIMKLTGFIFRRQDLFNEAIFHNLLYNKITGVIILPFVLLMAYTRGIFQDIAVYTGISVIIALNIIRFIRMMVFLLKSIVFVFYFILYLCTLEIIPLLVVLKLILSLS